jgi:hypothetical protein
LARFLDHVKVVETWKLMHRESWSLPKVHGLSMLTDRSTLGQEVETWINDKGNFVLM